MRSFRKRTSWRTRLPTVPGVRDCSKTQQAVSARTLRADWEADYPPGIPFWVIALSLSMVLGIASVRPPLVGIVIAIIGGFLISSLGGFRVQIGCTTAALVPVAFGGVHDHGFEDLDQALVRERERMGTGGSTSGRGGEV